MNPLNKSMMPHLYKTIFLLFTMLFFSLIAFSQETKEEKEIVMSKQELESFLRKIAMLKKQRMQQETEENIDYLYRSYRGGDRTHNYYYQSNDLKHEIERLNHRLDALMARDNETADYDRYSTRQNSEVTQPDDAGQPVSPIPSTATVSPSPTVTVVNKQPPLTGSVMLPVSGGSNNKKIDALQTQVDALNKELYTLSNLSGQDTSSASYSKEINNLKEQIATLQAEITRTKTAVYAEKEQPRLPSLEQYRHVIYFSNNSAEINSLNRDELRRLALKVKPHKERVTVLINGFASSTGNAMYNNKLSFYRTEAVKQVLLGMGLSARNIVSLHHGVDPLKNLAEARRAEITLLVY